MRRGARKAHNRHALPWPAALKQCSFPAMYSAVKPKPAKETAKKKGWRRWAEADTVVICALVFTWQVRFNLWADRRPLTGRVSTRKALPALHDDLRVTATAQLQVHLAVWETTIEEVWPRSEGEKRSARTHSENTLAFAVHYHHLIVREPCLPANNKLDGVGENSI